MFSVVRNTPFITCFIACLIMSSEHNDPGGAENLSDYVNTLDSISKSRYIEKIKLVGAVDPFTIPLVEFTGLTSAVQYPRIQYPDVYHYLIHTSSSFTGEDMKAYKSLEAYNYVINGHLRNIMVSRVTIDTFIVKALVTHSQSFSSEPVQSWAGIKEDGVVQVAHCTCMAGLSEACSHIAAVLFASWMSAKTKEDVTCTQLPCAWLNNTSKTNVVNPSPLFEIDFSRPAKKMKLALSPPTTRTVPQQKPIAPPTEAEKRQFYQSLHAAGTNSAILSTIPPYSDTLVPKSHALPDSLMSHCKQSHLTKSYTELLQESHELFPKFTIKQDQANDIEEYTRQQSRSKVWFDQRAGRVTASIVKSAISTDPSNPSVSLIKRICYPSTHQFKTDATKWGIEKEATARDVYTNVMSLNHTNLEVAESGMCVRTDVPFMGASPDGFVFCSCCGAGLLEIKCPYSARELSLTEAASGPDFCLAPDDNGGYHLKTSHSYYYQVQTQLYVTQRKYVDFILWLPSDIYIGRIFPDNEFMFNVIEKVSTFYKCCVLPEILGKWYSRPTASQTDTSLGTQCGDNKHTVWCYCRSNNTDSPMVQCKTDTCKFKKFHISCLRLKNVPKRKWMCPDCRKLSKVPSLNK